MAWAAAIPAIASVAGSLISSDAAQSSSKAARTWEQQMSDTAVQRRVADMRAAGVNPMLSVGGAAMGASTPSAQPAQVPDYGHDWAAGASSAMDAYQKSAQRTQMQLENANLEKQGNLLDAQTSNTLAQRDVNAATVGEVGSHQAVNMNTATNLVQAHSNLEADYAETAKKIGVLVQDMRGKEIDNNLKQQLNPLLLELQSYENQAAKAGLPALKNAAAAQDSWWMQRISPYLPDILKSTGAAGASAGAYRSLTK